MTKTDIEKEIASIQSSIKELSAKIFELRMKLILKRRFG